MQTQSDDEIEFICSGSVDGSGSGKSDKLKPEDTFKILIASDIHLGFKSGGERWDNNSNDCGRENDSFNTFEEVLKFGREENVDFVLLAGNLFHESKPGPETLHRAIQIMRKYCLGNKPVEFEYWGEAEKDFPSPDSNDGSSDVNYMNPDVNIAMPVFAIHGKNDEPVGSEMKISPLDQLMAAELLNHFGQWNDPNHLNIRAIPLVKGKTKLALYGLGHMKDERLYKIFRDGHVKFVRPKEEKDKEEWFNVFTIHQNRTKPGSRNNYLPESFVPYFFDVAIWGHEHESVTKPEQSSIGNRTWMIQPGSTIATAFSVGEAKDKHVGILEIKGRKFRFKPKVLVTVRPMILKDIFLKDVLPKMKIPRDKDPLEVIEKHVKHQVEMLLKNPLPTLPLLRVRVVHEHQNEVFNPVRFAQRFVGKVANNDIIEFKRISGPRDCDEFIDVDDLQRAFEREEEPDLDVHVESIVEDFFKRARSNNDDANTLEVLSEHALSEAVKTCVERDDKDAISLVIDKQIEKVCSHLMKIKDLDEEDIEEHLENYRKSACEHPEVDRREAINLLSGRPDRRPPTRHEDEDGDEDGVMDVEDEGADGHDTIIKDEDEDVRPSTSGTGIKGKRGRGATTSSRGRGSRGRGLKGSEPTPKSRGRGAKRDQPSREKQRGDDSMIQTRLNVTLRKNPPRRQTKGAMVFDDAGDSE